jgi:outer membrane protein OmpA-like peptidoglycan-associated protein
MEPITLHRGGVLACSLFVVAGCAAQETVPESFEAPPNTASFALHQQGAETPSHSPVVPSALQPSIILPSSTAATSRPDAVITLDQFDVRWTSEADQSLAAVATEVQADERILIRLHGYTPTRGSNGMSIAMAVTPLRAVRERLQALGVSSARILASNYGHQYPEQRNRSKPWVEVFLIRPNASR